MPTLKSHSTGNHRVDNVFCSEGLIDNIVKCTMDNAARLVKMDHYPIITQLNMQTTRTMPKPRPKFRLADWPELISILKTSLTNLPPPTEIADIQSFDSVLKALNGAIQDAVKKHVRVSRPCPY
jgi:hypothetical protein